MPTTLQEKPIKTLKEFSSFVEKQLPKSIDGVLWFRGTGRASYSLSPSIHRHPEVTDPQKLIELEIRIIERFTQRSVPFVLKQLDRSDDWETLFFMQHYGIPTRLLDWTENPFISLYFALTSASYQLKEKKRDYSEDAAIWVLDPCAWNRESLKDFTYKGGILSVNEALVTGYKPHTPFSSVREIPVAIFGTHNSPRIVAQRGVFTVFGKSVRGMEEIYANNNFPKDCLIKLIFPKDRIESLLTSLIAIGMTDSVAYPDLDGLAREMKRFFKFNV